MKRLIYSSDDENENENKNSFKKHKFMNNKSESESDYPDTDIDSDFDLDLNSMYFCSKCLCEYKNTKDCICTCHIKHELKNDNLRDILKEIERKKTKKKIIYENEDEDDNLMETEQEPQLSDEIYSGSSYDIYSDNEAEDADNEAEDKDTDEDTDED